MRAANTIIMEFEAMLPRKTLLLAGAVLLIGAATGAYALHAPAPSHAAEPKATKATPAAAPPVPVTAAHAQKGDVPIVLEGLGTVTPINTATIRTQVQGMLDSVNFVEGQDVKRGDVYLLQGDGDCVPCRHEGCGRHMDSTSDCLTTLPAWRVVSAAAELLGIPAPHRDASAQINVLLSQLQR